MARLIEFIKDVWELSAPRIRRADPLLMGAAIAFNSLFALFPLAIAFVALLTFLDATTDVLDGIYELLYTNLPLDTANFLVVLLQDSLASLESQRAAIVVISLLVALWSGSRAVYAIQKALRTVQGVVDDRGWLRARLLGVGVTAAATIGVLAGYAVLVIGGRIFTRLTELIGLDVYVYEIAAVVGAILVAWALLWAIYQWGAPNRMRAPGLSAGIVTGLVVLGVALVPSFRSAESSALYAFGTIAMFLVVLYYAGVVIVATPTVLDALLDAGEAHWRRYRHDDESQDVTTR